MTSEENKRYAREYYLKNKEKIKAKRVLMAEDLSDYQKHWRDTHPEYHKSYQTEYYKDPERKARRQLYMKKRMNEEKE